MSLVCSVEPLSGGRFRVSLEDGVSFPLYGKELEQFGIREGEELSGEAEAQILGELLPRRAKLCAMNYLQRSDRTEQQLRRKLGELLYPDDAVEQAVAYVRDFHYIDDVRYAENYIESKKDSMSLRRIEQELYARGVSRESFEAAALAAEVPDEERQIAAWLEKKHFSALAQRSERDRMIRFLLRRGYSMPAIQRVLLDITSKTV